MKQYGILKIIFFELLQPVAPNLEKIFGNSHTFHKPDKILENPDKVQWNP